MAVISVSLPDPLLESADRLIAEGGYSGRSELVRACLRDFIAANGAAPRAGPRSATVTLVYPEGCERHFSKLRHTYSDVIRTMMHGHAEGSCMEVFVLEGRGERIQEFADSLRGTRDALQVALVYTDAWREAHAEAEEKKGPRRAPHRH